MKIQLATTKKKSTRAAQKGKTYTRFRYERPTEGTNAFRLRHETAHWWCGRGGELTNIGWDVPTWSKSLYSNLTYLATNPGSWTPQKIVGRCSSHWKWRNIAGWSTHPYISNPRKWIWMDPGHICPTAWAPHNLPTFPGGVPAQGRVGRQG